MRALLLTLVAIFAIVLPASSEAQERSSYLGVGPVASTPSGWTEFCARYKEAECLAKDEEDPKDVVLTAKVWADMNTANKWVNDRVKPLSDIKHWGKSEQWGYGEDGYGDCDDYVLAKRRLFLKNGWPRSALLITTVIDKKGEGHAVLVVKTDRGDYVLDNQEEEILPWFKTGYIFGARQSQKNPNVWHHTGPPLKKKIDVVGQ